MNAFTDKDLMQLKAEALANDFLSLIKPILPEDREHLIGLFKQAEQRGYEKGKKESDENWDKVTDKMTDSSWNVGYEKGYEKAKKQAYHIADSYLYRDNGFKIREAIKAMEPEHE